jgi:hypothetical protein
MPHRAITALEGILRPHVGLGKSRLETLCQITVGMISARTVNLSHIASEWSGTAQTASAYRRAQRFFQHVQLPPDWSAPLVVRLLGLKGSWRLALDRTQWKVGVKDVNILMLAVITPRFRVPLMWSQIDGAGCSDSDARIALMQRYLDIFGAGSIELLLADREFVGLRWLRFLNDNNVPFAVRLKETLIVTPEGDRPRTLRSLLRTCRKKRVFRADLSDDPEDPLALNFAAKRIKEGELLIVVSNTPARAALDAYKSRWAIECLFGDAKTRASSTSCSASSPSRSPGPAAPPRCFSAAAPPSVRRTATSPSPGSASASTTSAGSCAPTPPQPSSHAEPSHETRSTCRESCSVACI